MLLEDCDGFTVTGNDVGNVVVSRGIFLVNAIDNASGGIVSVESSNYWMVATNIISGVSGATVSLAGANNSIGTNLAA